MKPQPSPRRHGIGVTKRRAIVVLFMAGFEPRSVARQLRLSTQDVLQALRKGLRGR